VARKREQVVDEEQQTQDPGFWDDPKKAQVIVKQINRKKMWIKSYDDLVGSLDDLQVLYEFCKEGEATEEEVVGHYDKLLVAVDDLEFKNMLSAEEDGLSAVLQVTAGAGGTESCDWAYMLMRMNSTIRRGM